jgi:DNA-binding MarR family transcriptional regulator
MPDKADDTARALLDVTMLLMRNLAARMRQGSQRLAPVHVGIMAKISEQACSLSDLAQHQCVRLPTISRSISLLVERGLVQRWVPEENRRQAMVRLTPEGRRALASMKREAERHTAAVLARLNEAEQRKVSAALSILGRALAPTVTPTAKRSGRRKTPKRPAIRKRRGKHGAAA